MFDSLVIRQGDNTDAGAVADSVIQLVRQMGFIDYRLGVKSSINGHYLLNSLAPIVRFSAQVHDSDNYDLIFFDCVNNTAGESF